YSPRYGEGRGRRTVACMSLVSSTGTWVVSMRHLLRGRRETRRVPRQDAINALISLSRNMHCMTGFLLGAPRGHGFLCRPVRSVAAYEKFAGICQHSLTLVGPRLYLSKSRKTLRKPRETPKWNYPHCYCLGCSLRSPYRFTSSFRRSRSAWRHG